MCLETVKKCRFSQTHKMGNFSFRRTVITARSFRFLCYTHTNTHTFPLSLHGRATLFLHPCQLRCMQFECTQFHIPRNAVNVCCFIRVEVLSLAAYSRDVHLKIEMKKGHRIVVFRFSLHVSDGAVPISNSITLIYLFYYFMERKIKHGAREHGETAHEIYIFNELLCTLKRIIFVLRLVKRRNDN